MQNKFLVFVTFFDPALGTVEWVRFVMQAATRRQAFRLIEQQLKDRAWVAEHLYEGSDPAEVPLFEDGITSVEFSFFALADLESERPKPMRPTARNRAPRGGPKARAAA